MAWGSFSASRYRLGFKKIAKGKSYLIDFLDPKVSETKWSI